MGLRSSPLAYTILPSSAGGLGLFQSFITLSGRYRREQNNGNALPSFRGKGFLFARTRKRSRVPYSPASEIVE